MCSKLAMFEHKKNFFFSGSDRNEKGKGQKGADEVFTHADFLVILFSCVHTTRLACQSPRTGQAQRRCYPMGGKQPAKREKKTASKKKKK